MGYCVQSEVFQNMCVDCACHKKKEISDSSIAMREPHKQNRTASARMEYGFGAGLSHVSSPQQLYKSCVLPSYLALC